MPLVEVMKQVRISAAHHIVGHKGKCAHEHGHNYLIQAFCQRDMLDPDFQSLLGSPENAMVRDFYDVGQDLRVVVEVADHEDLNDLFPFVTTAENLAIYWLGCLYELSDLYTRVRVWETDDCYAEAIWSPNAYAVPTSLASVAG